MLTTYSYFHYLSLALVLHGSLSDEYLPIQYSVTGFFLSRLSNIYVKKNKSSLLLLLHEIYMHSLRQSFSSLLLKSLIEWFVRHLAVIFCFLNIAIFNTKFRKNRNT